MKKKAYFAAPLFSRSELLYNAHVVEKLRQAYPDLDIFVPQESAEVNDKTEFADSLTIARVDTENLLESDLVFAVLDGLVVDPGVASEIGVAYQAGIPVLGLYSDSRQAGADNPEKLAALQDVAESQFPYINLYTVGLVKLNGEIVTHEDDLVKAAKNYL